MKKNSQIHLKIETDSLDKLKKQAQEEGISVSELCRKKLKGEDRLERIEMMLEKVLKIREIS